MSKYVRIKQGSIATFPNKGIYITNSEKWKLILYAIFTIILSTLSRSLKKGVRKK